MKNKLNIERLKKLLLIEISFTYKYLLASLIPVLLINFLMSLDKQTDVLSMLDTSMSMFKAYFFIGGIAFTSYCFSEMHKKDENHFWFMFPASSLEKFLSKLLSSLVYYYFLISIGFLILILISQLFFLGRGGFDSPYYSNFFIDTFPSEIISYFKDYLLFNSIFLLGAIVFKKRTVLYTAMTSIAVIVLFLIFLIAFINFGLNLGIVEENAAFNFSFSFDSILFSYLKPSFLIIFVLIMWCISYYIMKRKQVSHGI